MTVYSYGAMLALAVVLCAFLLGLEAKRKGIAKNVVYDLVFWTVLWGIVGARIFYVFITWDYFSNFPLEMLMINKGGLAWQGGFIGGAVAGMSFCRANKLSVLTLLDLSAPYLALGQAIGRIGCFLNGCCFGKPSAQGIFCPLHGERLFPTQLYETFGLFLVFIVLKALQRKPQQAGLLFAYYLCLSAVERFIVEFYRGDHELLAFDLSFSQYISLLIFAAGVFVYLRFRK